MQSVKRAQFLNITFLFILFPTAPADTVFGSIIVPLTSMHTSI